MCIFDRMVKLLTQVDIAPRAEKFELDGKFMLLGSCFSDAIAARMKDAKLNITSNPLGTTYNPASIADVISLLDSTRMFDDNDCVEMGAGAGKICSFHHHTSFARETSQEFLDNANASLAQARTAWERCAKVIITLGTSYIWERDGAVVNNCLKRPGKEFTHRMLTVQEIRTLLRQITSVHPDKEFIWTVSPIRHLAQGAHENTLSKSSLHIALAQEGLEYFPSYEILMDELRDYRFYAEDLTHPAKVAVDIIWERFLKWAFSDKDIEQIRQNEKLSKSEHHVRRT